MSNLLYNPKEDTEYITPRYYNGDVVATHAYESIRGNGPKTEGAEGVVHYIHTSPHDLRDTRPTYDIEYDSGASVGILPPTHFAVPEKYLALVRRGNLWNYFHGEPLVFATISEEGDFFKDIGRVTQIMRSSRGHSGWTFPLIMRALKRKKIDMFVREFGYFKAYTYDDPNVGKRVREFMLEKYKGWRKKIPRADW